MNRRRPPAGEGADYAQRHFPQVAPEIHHDGEQRAGVDRNIDEQALVRPSEDMRGQDEMTG